MAKGLKVSSWALNFQNPKPKTDPGSSTTKVGSIFSGTKRAIFKSIPGRYWVGFYEIKVASIFYNSRTPYTNLIRYLAFNALGNFPPIYGPHLTVCPSF